MQMYDEFKLRRDSMKIVYALFGSLGGGIIVLVILNPSLIFFITLCLAAVVIQGLLLDGYINRMEKKLLEQLLEFFAAVRHSYHRHGMVSDAIDEAGEIVGQDISLHAIRIYEAISAASPDEALEKYYETAPNRFLKAFAGISRLIMEFGDRKRAQGSLYLRGISTLTGEVHLDLIRRSKLDYLLKGLHIIALVPVFFTKPVEMWARGNFPLMDQFYLSKAGMIIKILLLLIILISYVLLQKLKSEEETAYRAGREQAPWESRLYQWKWVRIVVKWFQPLPSSAAYYRISQLLKDTNHHLRVEWLQVRRIVLFMICLLFTLGSAITLHLISQNGIIHEPPSGYVLFGKVSPEESEKAKESVEMDAIVMNKTGMSGAASYDTVANLTSSAMRSTGNMPNHEQLTLAVNRILDKLDRWNGEYLKWWEVVLSLFAGYLGYMIPNIMLWFRRKMILMDMRHEVYQFGTMIAILKELERISVEEILEWMHSYAVIFKMPIQKCLLHYGHGAEAALQQMKEEVKLEEFQRLTDKLLLAVEKITIARAFDDLESDMSYHFEQRRLDYEKSLDTKAGLGRLIGFAPMYSLIFAYLVIPLIWMSFKQMDIYFTQIQKL
ncbi:hypothetical protein [Paenibacillus segetis]|uniref:Flp pilus assembly protein TadB n=1 Tax=Paenibacillus segetis TaxID=1325360 RepID=A0ABQ1YEG7_9BACL|nr:hypothetical protein [Paenibacillus segetis]GGH22719.1 hypothetical protein GCM10008013_21340 [Paenibacillus segetis]